ncbi:hypothetical protein EPI10_031924 [Gossypium australe]|uniref:Uncharacterized protein n=1 Tax=Gossypium australe TaxID=47621 RepID=A0A5B6X1M9_9ROSI|nr:hypothetical protein EPI10_031924 [Gossypium australe]
MLALLLSSETHRDTLMKVLNETYVDNDISVNKLNHLVNNISTDNFIFFNDDEIPPGVWDLQRLCTSTPAAKEVLIDGGSALNVLPLSSLNRLPMDSSHMKTCQNIVRAFDGTERGVMGRIEIPLLIGPNTYEVDFLVMDIKPSYTCLLGRPWIHTAGAVLSSLHQKLKLVTEGRLVMISAEEDIIASITSNAPYVGTDDEAIEYPDAQNFSNYKNGPATDGRERSFAGRGLGRYIQGRVEVPMLKDKRDRFGLGFKPDTRQRKKEMEKKQERRKA